MLWESRVFRWVLLTHLAATLYMVGVIWMVQLAHYPLIGWIGADELPAWQAENLRRTTWVVGIPMLVEAATAAVLVGMDDARDLGPAVLAGGVLLGLVWASTALLQVPAHDSLARSFDPEAVRRLVSTNWLRTILWTARGGLALYMVERAWGTA